VNALVISADPDLRELLRVAIRTAERRTGQPWRSFQATNGIDGLKIAWRELPDLVVADEITSGAGAFAVAKDLKGAAEPHPAGVILVLARAQDDWLAKWSGADAWVTKPVDPFLLADKVLEVTSRPRKETA
jgi:DNA-binding response OmpR family regulator